MKIKVTLEYEIDPKNYAFVGDEIGDHAILDQEQCIITGALIDCFGERKNITVKVERTK